jgi:hypothetical protein
MRRVQRLYLVDVCSGELRQEDVTLVAFPGHGVRDVEAVGGQRVGNPPLMRHELAEPLAPGAIDINDGATRIRSVILARRRGAFSRRVRLRAQQYDRGRGTR